MPFVRQLVMAVVVAMGTACAMSAAQTQPHRSDSFTLIGTQRPDVERLTSEARCGTTTFTLSLVNRGTAFSHDFSFKMNGRTIGHAGTTRVNDFLRTVRDARITSLTCAHSQGAIIFSLSAVMFQPPPGTTDDDVTRFFSLGRVDEPN